MLITILPGKYQAMIGILSSLEKYDLSYGHFLLHDKVLSSHTLPVYKVQSICIPTNQRLNHLK